MADKGNDIGSRIVHRTGQGFAHTVPAEEHFGTPEEIANRVGGTFKTLPDNVPSNFRQLGPKAVGGAFDEKRPTGRSGNAKFGNSRRYT